MSLQKSKINSKNLKDQLKEKRLSISKIPDCIEDMSPLPTPKRSVASRK